MLSPAGIKLVLSNVQYITVPQQFKFMQHSNDKWLVLFAYTRYHGQAE